MRMREALIAAGVGLLIVTATGFAIERAPAPPQGAVLQPEVAITTATGADLERVLAGRKDPHRTEVSRTDRLTAIVSLRECEKDAAGECDASADLVLFTPDGRLHQELKGIDLATGRGTATLAFTSEDAAGLYRIEATVRDLRARRFGRTERSFAAK